MSNSFIASKLLFYISYTVRTSTDSLTEEEQEATEGRHYTFVKKKSLNNRNQIFILSSVSIVKNKKINKVLTRASTIYRNATFLEDKLQLQKCIFEL